MFRNLICVLLSFTLVFQSSFALEVNGELKNAVGEKFASDPVTGLVEGRIYYNTTTKTLRVYDGTNWKNKVDTNSTQTLTNKTIDGNSNTLNVLAPTQLEGFVPIANGGTGQATKAAAFDALSPNGSQGDLTYRGVSSNVALPIGANNQVLTVSSGYPSWQDSTGGAGSGEKNYITNPSAATAITGWNSVGDLDVARTTTASELPREHTTGTGIKITADANTQSTADYVYCDFTLDDVDLNRKLKIQWDQKQFGAYVAGNLAVVITTQADRTTAVATPDVTAIPAYDGMFSASFDTGSTATLSLVIRATTDMATDTGIVISDVIVGPGTIAPVPAVGPTVSYVPTITGFGTPTGVVATYAQTSNRIKVSVKFTAGTVTTTTASVSLPNSWTTNDGSNASAARIVGRWARNSSTATQVKEGPIIVPNTANSTVVNFAYADTAVAAAFTTSQNADNIIGTGQLVELDFEVSVNELAGSPNYAGQNDVSFISDDGSADVFGPNGALVPSVSVGTGASRTITVSNFQATDNLTVEYNTGNGNWGQAENYYPYIRQSTKSYGIRGYWASSTTYTIEFGDGGVIPNNATYAGNSTGSWADENAAGARFRIVTAKAGAAVGFGAATNDIYGLVRPAYNLLGSSQFSLSNTDLVRSGTYTPTATANNNLDSNPSVTANSMIWSQVGKVVTCSGFVGVDPTTINTASSFTLTLPVLPTSNFSDFLEGLGTANFSSSGLGSTGTIGTVNATSGAKTVTLGFYATDTNIGRNFFYQFQYVVN